MKDGCYPTTAAVGFDFHLALLLSLDSVFKALLWPHGINKTKLSEKMINCGIVVFVGARVLTQ